MSDAPDSHDDLGDLDELIRRVDPDRWISSRFIADPAKRADVIALYAFDHELARAPRVSSNPLLGEIRLTWWREALDEIFEGRPVRRHPTAQALAEVVARRELGRALLDEMVEVRYEELSPALLTKDQAMAVAFGSAGTAAALAIEIIDGKPHEGFAGGWSGVWALSRMIMDSRLQPDAIAEASAEVRVSIAEARTIERGDISTHAFPAVAHAALAPLYASGRRLSMLSKQARITWAVARGRI
jgi:phytoene synthase